MTFEPSAEFSLALLDWYDSARRDLPWRRRQDDAYAIWISEIMLQQTTVNAVVGFYERWMERFPTVEALADAPLDEVLRYWAGLGYYSRARNIKKAAESIRNDHAGRLPSSVAELIRLPGIGRYTAGAISSIAYNQDAPILDANVVRVLSRLDGMQGDIRSAPLQAKLWRLAGEMIPAGQARNFNQALMELGALVCSPREPNCSACPVRRWCTAGQTADPEAYPSAAVPKQWRTARHAAIALARGGRVLIVKRPEDATVWAGFWELPRTIARESETLEDCALRAALETLGVNIETGRSFGSVNHVVTNTKIALTGFDADISRHLDDVSFAVRHYAWVDEKSLAGYAIASPHRKLLNLWFATRSQASLAF